MCTNTKTATAPTSVVFSMTKQNRARELNFEYLFDDTMPSFEFIKDKWSQAISEDDTENEKKYYQEFLKSQYASCREHCHEMIRTSLRAKKSEKMVPIMESRNKELLEHFLQVMS